MTFDLTHTTRLRSLALLEVETQAGDRALIRSWPFTGGQLPRGGAVLDFLPGWLWQFRDRLTGGEVEKIGLERRESRTNEKRWTERIVEKVSGCECDRFHSNALSRLTGRGVSNRTVRCSWPRKRPKHFLKVTAALATSLALRRGDVARKGRRLLFRDAAQLSHPTASPLLFVLTASLSQKQLRCSQHRCLLLPRAFVSVAPSTLGPVAEPRSPPCDTLLNWLP